VRRKRHSLTDRSTACADTIIRLFHPSGRTIRTIKTQDVVRALCRLPLKHATGAHFASAGNDAIIRLWTINGREICQLHGHENFIYSLTALPDGQLVSSSEDRTARIWNNQQCIQTITHPAISVWSVAACPENGDIVTGASDRMVRIFSKSKDRHAEPAVIQAFEDSVKGSAIPQQQVGNINKEQLPGPEFLKQKSGTKEGQVQMIKETNGNVSAYQWSTAANTWISVGTVVDAAGSSGRKITHEGKDYDYVFDVDIEDGKPPLKLPYNLSQNPYEVARKFCETNKLPITYLDQVTNFIVQNTQGATIGQASGSQSHVPGADPWGTESRYRPGEASPAPQQPPAARPKVLPQKEYLDITTANLKTIYKKIQEFNQQIIGEGSKDLSLNPSDLEVLESTITHLEKGLTKNIDPTGIDVVLKIATAWPQDKRLPGLDLLRVLAAASSKTAAYQSPAGESLVALLAGSGVFEPAGPPNNTMLAARAFSNLFKTEEGRAVADHEFEAIHALIKPFITSSARTLVIALTTIYINYAVLLSTTSNADRALTLLDDLTRMLMSATDSEAVYRALVAAGTLLCLGKDFCEAARDVFDIEEAVARAEEKVKEPRVKNVVAEIREKLD